MKYLVRRLYPLSPAGSEEFWFCYVKLVDLLQFCNYIPKNMRYIVAADLGVIKYNASGGCYCFGPSEKLKGFQSPMRVYCKPLLGYGLFFDDDFPADDIFQLFLLGINGVRAVARIFESGDLSGCGFDFSLDCFYEVNSLETDSEAFSRIFPVFMEDLKASAKK